MPTSGNTDSRPLWRLLEESDVLTSLSDCLAALTSEELCDDLARPPRHVDPHTRSDSPPLTSQLYSLASHRTRAREPCLAPCDWLIPGRVFEGFQAYYPELNELSRSNPEKTKCLTVPLDTWEIRLFVTEVDWEAGLMKGHLGESLLRRVSGINME